jgi:hypothetical protein
MMMPAPVMTGVVSMSSVYATVMHAAMMTTVVMHATVMAAAVMPAMTVRPGRGCKRHTKSRYDNHRHSDVSKHVSFPASQETRYEFPLSGHR